MAELEIHHEHGHESDAASRSIGISAALIAMLLAIVSIASHRAHTEAVLVKTDANDKWSYYQAQRRKLHNLELGADLMSSIPNPSPATLQRLEHYTNDKVTYDQRSKQAQEDAREKDHESELVEKKAQMYDFGEGLLEIGVVMSSMFFISRNWMFPIVGGVSALAGTVLGLIGYLK